MEGQLALTMFIVVCGILLLGFPVALSLGGTALGFAALGILIGHFDPDYLTALTGRIFGTMGNETLVAVPLFILMGVVLERAKIAENLLANMAGHIGEQVLGNFCSLQHDAHKNEQGHGHKGFVAHGAEDAASQRGEIVGVKVSDQYTQRRKSQRGAAKAQCHRETQQQYAADDNKHGERQLPFHQALSRCWRVVSARAISARA